MPERGSPLGRSSPLLKPLQFLSVTLISRCTHVGPVGKRSACPFHPANRKDCLPNVYFGTNDSRQTGWSLCCVVVFIPWSVSLYRVRDITSQSNQWTEPWSSIVDYLGMEWIGRLRFALFSILPQVYRCCVSASPLPLLCLRLRCLAESTSRYAVSGSR